MDWVLDGEQAADNLIPAPVEVVQAVFADYVYGHPAFGFGYKSRQAGEYNDYTRYHLPNRFVAKPAIFAARIARSSRATRG